MSPPYFSLIVPCYNEQHRIERNVKKILKFMSGHAKKGELIFVDDGSTDTTVSQLTAFLLSQHVPFSLLSLPRNAGKGAAIKKGALHAKGTYILFTDLDLSVPLTYVDALLKNLEKNNIVIGVRRNTESKIIKRQPLLRELLGRIYTNYARTILQLEHRDMTCGFKGFQRSTAKKLFLMQRINRWAFDSEILYLAKKYEMTVYELSIVWKNDTNTKVTIVRDAFFSFIDVLRIRFNEFSNKY